MPERKPSGARPPEDRTAAQREADHASLALLSDTLVPALVEKLAASGLGELEVREGSWHIRLRRPPAASAPPARRGDRTRTVMHVDRDGWSSRDGNPTGTSPGGGSRAEEHGETRAQQRDEARPELRADDPYTIGDPPRSVATSPTVGVFRPEVAVGTHVQAGDRVGVVDLLGIPQHVPSPIDGTLVEVFPAAGEAVEYGEAIAAVESDAPMAQPGVDDANHATDGDEPAADDGERG